MSSDEKDDLLKLVNASGFLFQLRVEDEISKTLSSRGNTVITKEHKWKDEASGNEGFIDLVLPKGTNGKMVIECKRVIDATWIFLAPKEATLTKRANVLWSYKFEDGNQVAAWDELKLKPESMESFFCIIRGQGEKDQPMLERISSSLLQSTECLAAEEQHYPRLAGREGIRCYFPVIVTTAKLKLCKCDYSKVDLSTGQIIDAEFEDVPFLRFTKSMSTRLSSSRPPKNISESAREGQRTIFVINAENISTILSMDWDFEEPKFSNEFWPWELPFWKTVA
jgi:hypothetical protein